MKQLDHPFICKLYQIIETPTYVYLIQEYVENGTLLAYVNRHIRLAEVPARRYFSQLLSALDYLHNERMVAHRDIKAENVLLDVNFNIRLIDFGLSHAFSQGQPMMNTMCGSPHYAAPEMILGRPYTKAADVWSAGVLLYAMVTGALPFDDPGDIPNVLRQIVRSEPEFPDSLTSSLIDLLKRILTKTPEARLDIEHIKTHPWFSQSEYAKIFEIQFSSDEWIMPGVDRTILDEMEGLGIDSRAVAEALLLGEYTPETAVYALMHRQRITERIRAVMEGLRRPVVTGLSAAPILTSMSGLGGRVVLMAPQRLTVGRRISAPSIGSPGRPTTPTPAVVKPALGGVIKRAR
jgi:serine/threonine protein kinase